MGFFGQHDDFLRIDLGEATADEQAQARVIEAHLDRDHARPQR